MLEALHITETEAAGLAELAQLDLAMARHFAARAQAAEDPETANQLARSYQRAARSYRQSLALKVRLQKDIAQAAHIAEAARRDAEPQAVRIAERKKQLRERVEKLLWSEIEELDDEFELDGKAEREITAALEARLEAWSGTPNFLHEATEVLVTRLITEIEPVIDAVLGPEPDVPAGDLARRESG